jgi:hypothetical protein
VTRSPKSPSRSWRSTTREAWRSTLSWMRWRQRRQERLRLERESLLLEMRQLLQQELFQSLMGALTPLAAALQRQDNLLLAETHRLEWKVETLEEMLLELLSQQPTPGSRMRDELGIRSRT